MTRSPSQIMKPVSTNLQTIKPTDIIRENTLTSEATSNFEQMIGQVEQANANLRGSQTLMTL